MPILDMCALIQTHRLPFVLNPNNEWNTFAPHLAPYLTGAWNEVKFLNQQGNGLNPDLNNIPHNSGGIYIFIIKPNIIDETHLYIVYVGRARFTNHQHLQKRVKRYLTDTRPKIQVMRENWGNYLFVKYLTLNDNAIIDDLEKELIRVILPPCNDQYPTIYNQAMQAAF